MGVILIPGGLFLPSADGNTNTSASESAKNISAAGDKYAVVVSAPKTGTITKLGFRTGSVTTGATVDVRLETVGADGNPTGTLFDTNSNAAQVILDTDDQTWFEVVLTGSAAVTAGDLLAIVIVNPGTPGDIDIRHVSSSIGATQVPYNLVFAAAAWTKDSSGPNVALGYSDGSFPWQAHVFPTSAQVNVIYNNTDTPDERALRFKLPVKSRVIGAWADVDSDAAWDLVLYDSDGSTALLTHSQDPDVRLPDKFNLIFVLFNATTILEKDTLYRLSVKPTTASDISIREFSADSVAIMEGFDQGAEFHKSSRTDAGAWTEDTTTRPRLGLIIDQIDIPGLVPLERGTNRGILRGVLSGV